MVHVHLVIGTLKITDMIKNSYDIIQVNLCQLAPPVKNLEYSVGAKYYCLHALADGTQQASNRKV